MFCQFLQHFPMLILLPRYYNLLDWSKVMGLIKHSNKYHKLSFDNTRCIGSRKILHELPSKYPSEKLHILLQYDSFMN